MKRASKVCSKALYGLKHHLDVFLIEMLHLFSGQMVPAKVAALQSHGKWLVSASQMKHGAAMFIRDVGRFFAGPSVNPAAPMAQENPTMAPVHPLGSVLNVPGVESLVHLPNRWQCVTWTPKNPPMVGA